MSDRAHPPTTVDRLTAADRAAWEELFAGYHAFYGRPDWPSRNFDEAWQRILSDDQIHARGARVDGRLVGIVHFLVHPSTSSADVCFLQDLFTAPRARGRGVARALIAEVERWARERGCARVYWHTQAGNETARRLYDQVAENRGFIQYLIQL
jgi:GNAT superfamily N-acetyltransferase